MLTLRGSAYAVRPATLEDADDVAALSNAWSMNREGMAIHDAEELRVDWQVPGFCLESDTRVVHEASGRLAAYASVWDIGEPHVRVGSVLRVHPDHEESGLDETLLDWIELRTQWAIEQAPPEARVIVTNGAFSLDRRRKDLLERRGFKMLRHFWRLRIEMEGPPQVHDVPEEIDIRPYDPAADLEPTVIAVREAFRDHWGHVEGDLDADLDQWRHWIEEDPQFDPSVWFLAWADEEVAGVSLGLAQRPESEDLAYVSTLGVRKPWRGRGLARALLTRSFATFYARGKSVVDLDADSANLTGAIRLYRGVGMQPIWQNDAYEKEVRPGVDFLHRG